MANYIVIGGDQKEYGPITADGVRQWIAESRLNRQSLIKVEGEPDFRPLGAFPEFAADLLTGDAIPKIQPAASGAATGAMPLDYDLDLGGCVTRGWALVKKNFGVFLVSLLVLALVAFAFFGTLGLMVSIIVPKHLMTVPAFKVVFNLILSAVSALIMGPLAGGLYLVYIKSVRGAQANVGDLFAGFQKSFPQLFLGYMVVVLATGLCMAPFNYVSTSKLEPLLAQIQSASPAQIQSVLPEFCSALFSTLPILLICMIPVTYLSVNWMFSLPLIIDKELDFWTAMKTSWKMVHKHWWHVFGLVVITGLLNIAGICLCCVGLLLTIPVGLAALMFAYETIFSEGPAA
jgi:uncharacterized membrane protein